MKDMQRVLRQLSLIGQLGLSVVTPILMCLLVCWLLTTRAGAGTWVYIPGFILGLGSAFVSVWKVYQSVNGGNRRDDGRGGANFNSHG